MYKSYIKRFLGQFGAHVLNRFDSAFSEYYTQHFADTAAAFGPGSLINGRVRVSGLSKLSIGHNVHIGGGAFIRAEGGLSIGDNTHIARAVTIYTHNHNYNGESLPYDDEKIMKPVEIGKNVWVGINVTIVPGSKIGEGAIIGAGAVVVGSVPPLTIVGGAPACVIGRRDKGHYKQLESKEKYGGIDGMIIEDYKKLIKS